MRLYFLVWFFGVVGSFVCVCGFVGYNRKNGRMLIGWNYFIVGVKLDS